MSDGMGREFTYLSSHATNRYFIPNWGSVVKALLYSPDGERNPIGRRTQSDRAANVIRSDGERCTMTRT